MARGSLVERPKEDARRPHQSGDRRLDVEAIEDAIADGLAKVPVVKRVLCSNECSTFEVTIVHDSPDNGAAVCLIANCMIDVRKRIVRSGVAPDDVYLKRLIFDESDGHTYGNWGEKTLFEREAERPQHGGPRSPWRPDRGTAGVNAV